MSRPRYLIETFGCQMNVHDSERMAGLLEQAGYERAASDRDADVVVINTCSVRDHAEEKLYTRLGQLRVLEEETGRSRVLTVAGCVAQQEGDALFKNVNGRLIDVVLGTHRLKMLPELVERARASAGHSRREVDVARFDDVTFPVGVTRRGDAVRAYVTIIEGCNDHCAFCVVPTTRGHERMRAKADILLDVHEAVASGRREIQLLGQIVNHYQAPDDPRCDFAQLLAEVDQVPGVERIRFASPHPRHTGARLIEAVRDLPRVCKHLHLPLQSGSTEVLRRMRRRHTREEYLDLVGRIRETVPGVTLSTDLIVGLPGRDRARLRRHDVARRGCSLSQHLFVQVLGASQHAGGQADARRRAGSREDRPHRGAAIEAEGDPERAARRGGGTGGRGARGFGEPPARGRAVRAHERQHGGELSGAPRGPGRLPTCGWGVPCRY